MAFSRSKIRIAIADANTNPTDLIPGDFITGQITNYSKSGGENDVESVAAFGGFIDKEKPQSQFELSLEVVPDETDADRWDSLAYTNDVSAGVYVSGGTVSDKSVFITTESGFATPKSWCFNSANVTMLDLDHAADDNQTGNFNLKFSPTTTDGTPNFMTKALAITAMPNWAVLTKQN